MNTLGNSVISCAVRLETLREDPSEKRCCFCLLVLIQRCLKKETALTLEPCAHKFRVTCISQWINKSPGCPLDRRPITGRTPQNLLSINLHTQLIRSVNENQMWAVCDILLARLTLEQRLHLGYRNPLPLALEKNCRELAGKKSLANSGTKVLFVTQWALNCCFVRDTEKL